MSDNEMLKLAERIDRYLNGGGPTIEWAANILRDALPLIRAAAASAEPFRWIIKHGGIEMVTDSREVAEFYGDFISVYTHPEPDAEIVATDEIASLRAQLASARKALEEIDAKCSYFERIMCLPDVREFKDIWYLAKAALTDEQGKPQ